MSAERVYKIIHRLTDNILSASGRDKVLHWLKEPEDGCVKDEALFRVWNEIDAGEITPVEVQRALSSVKSRLGLSNESRRKRIFWVFETLRYAAVLAVVLVTGLVVWQVMERRVSSASDMIECFVPYGQKKNIELPDGTKVMLNAGTLFVYPKHFYGEKRRVYLTGEAYFDVTHDKNKPFVVSAGPLNITVLGTSFNVEAYPGEDDIFTTLHSGRVKVSRTGDENNGVLMRPDDRVVYHVKDGSFEMYHVESGDFTSWTEGEIRFVDEPLFAMLRTLERHYGVVFKYDNIDINEKYTMKFDSNDKIEEVMQILILTASNMEYVIDNNVVFLRSVKKGGTGR